MPFLIGVGIFLVVGAIIAILATKTGFLGDIANILLWLIRKIWKIVVFIIVICVAILIIGGLITFFS